MLGLLPRSPFWNTAVYNLILPFLGGLSDAACRVAMKTVGLTDGGVQGHGMGMGEGVGEQPGVGGQLSARPYSSPTKIR